MSAADFRDMWRLSVERHPDRTAVEIAETGARTTYSGLHHEAEALAARMGAAGIAAGELVGLRMGDRRRFCVALLGTWLAGAVPVPVSATAPGDYVHGLLRRLRTGTILTEDDTSPDGVAVLLIGDERSVAAGSGGAKAGPGFAPGLAYVMHTSGSTGVPKAVALSHRALAAYCRAFTAATGLDRDDRFLQVAPVTFDVVFEELLPIWSVGGTAVLAPGIPADPARLLAAIDASGVTVAELTTVYWRLLVRHLRACSQQVPRSLRLLLVGGEPASVGLIEDSLALDLPLAHVYGVTEAGVTSTIEFFESTRPVSAVSVGVPLANSAVFIVDDAGSPVGPGRTGEVWIGGDSLAEGYLGSPEETERRFVERSDGAIPNGRYYRTGDLGRMTEHGQLEILERVDDEVKVSGVRVDPREVEAALNSSALVAASAVMAVEGPGRTRHLHGFVVPVAGADACSLPGSLRDWLSERLPDHLVPERVVVVDAIPVTEHGKVDRRTLASRPGAGEYGAREYGAAGPVTGEPVTGERGAGEPVTGERGAGERGAGERGAGERGAAGRTDTERLVAAAWTAVLGRAPASVDQNFGDAGGNSLALLSLVVTLAERGMTVTSTDCLTYPTVRALAAFLDRSSSVPGGLVPGETVPGGSVPGGPVADETVRDGADMLAERQRQERRSEYLRRRRAASRSAR